MFPKEFPDQFQKAAEAYEKATENSGLFGQPIVDAIVALRVKALADAKVTGGITNEHPAFQAYVQAEEHALSFLQSKFPRIDRESATRLYYDMLNGNPGVGPVNGPINMIMKEAHQASTKRS